MKKYTNNLLPLALILSIAIGCKQKEKEPVKTQQEILQEITSVVGIGKVIPSEGWIVISSPVNGIVKETRIKEGDSVKKDQLLVLLQTQTEDLAVLQNEAALKTQKAENKVNVDNLQREKILLAELEAKYKTSLALFEKNAETAENLANDKSNWLQQKQAVNALKAQINANTVRLNEQQLAIQKSKQQLAELRITAPQSGIISELSADIGSLINTSTAVGKIVDPNNIIIEAEVDELMANKIKTGQKVVLHSVGRRDSIAEGVITYTSPILSNKSILYESMGEGEDRRVRIVRIKPNQSLLINSKVECEINIQ